MFPLKAQTGNISPDQIAHIRENICLYNYIISGNLRAVFHFLAAADQGCGHYSISAKEGTRFPLVLGHLRGSAVVWRAGEKPFRFHLSLAPALVLGITSERWPITAIIVIAAATLRVFSLDPAIIIIRPSFSYLNRAAKRAES